MNPTPTVMTKEEIYEKVKLKHLSSVTSENVKEIINAINYEAMEEYAKSYHKKQIEKVKEKVMDKIIELNHFMPEESNQERYINRKRIEGFDEVLEILNSQEEQQ